MTDSRLLRLALAALAVLCSFRCTSTGAAPRDVVRIAPGADLAQIVERTAGPVRFVLAEGTYALAARPYRDPSCANCQDPATGADSTVGLRVSGTRIEIVSERPGLATIVTNAGYGILLDRCDSCVIDGVTITGGRRDPDGNASDAAIVARDSRATIRNTVIRANVGDPAIVRKTIVGIIGIAGREGTDLTIERNRIIGNSWDGIALYRGARATIRDNVVDGVDKARGDQVGGGRGVGIGLTWDARATIERNLVTRYWKGIGVFVAARAEVRENIVEDVITWGITLWDAGKGDAAARIERNVVWRVGACGASITREARCDGEPCAATANVFALTGLNPKYDPPDYYCRQEALAREAVPPGFVIERNVFHMNREPGDAPGHEDVSRELFLRDAVPLAKSLATGWALSQSRFVREVEAPPASLGAVPIP